MLMKRNDAAANVFAMARTKSQETRLEAERRRQAFRAFMKTHNIHDLAAWARAAGLPNANSLYNFLKGRSRSLSQPTLEALAHAIPGARPGDLFKESVTSLNGSLHTGYIRGEIQAGLWKDREEWPQGDWKPITLPANKLHRSKRSYFLIVRGNSMNLLFPEGTIIECVNLPDYDGALKTGDKVVVVRRDRNGLYETTCKELRVRDDKAELWPRSDDPEFQGVIGVPWPPEDGEVARDDGIEEIAVKAVVIRSIREEV